MEPKDRETLHEIKADLKETKALVTAIATQQGIDHFILDEHQRRSTQLEARVDPLERDMQFARRIVALLLTAAAVYEAIRLTGLL